MRTTITLEPDVEALIKQAMRERNASFKEVVNQAVRDGLGKPRTEIPRFTQRTAQLGRPKIDLTKALALVDELDDQQHQ